MRAMVLTQFGGVENLQLQDLPIPRPQQGEVLVKIAASSINPIDVKTRQGQGAANFTQVTPPMILGWDLSGTVVVCGTGVEDWKPGDTVFGSVGFPGLGHAHAEYAAVPSGHLARKPENVSHKDAAAASMTGLTAWQALTTRRLGPGDKVLVHGASGGVGHMAVQIARAFGAQVTGTSSAANREFVLSLGAAHHIDYRVEAWSSYPRDFDFVLDTVGGEATRASLGLLRKGGTLVSILPGQRHELAEAAAAHGVQFHFVLMHSDGEDMAAVADLLARGLVQPAVSHWLSLDQLAQAHVLQESRRTVGKIVLVP
ncbi:NADP-dependent oxidoreductase [Rahnella sp. CG8]|uniref:NADP-dependent oxidoreductase n=1 Tax=Rahnella sp. CG8 TaxID=2726078 RepID=UPI002033968D|nr:NADP-dependent oxidoreductase [Rahnella sp. CG8]MCM2448478.1 NADP-dependent oxidoreductase [Rahnella sp. CG8]